MPAENAPNVPSTTANGRKRPPQGRVVPAIPLTLGRAKPSKQQPRREETARANGTGASAPAEGAHDEHGKGDPVKSPANAQTNGDRRLGQNLATSSIPSEHPNGTRASAAGTPVSGESAPMSISDGITPENAPAQPQRPSTPPATTTGHASQPVTSPSPTGRSTDKFDIRPIRTELPPAFVPSSERGTPQSGTAWNRPSNQPNRNHHPSTSSIRFGGYDSLTASPVPPQSAGSDLNSAQWPPLGAKPPAHAHHASRPSETFARRGQDTAHDLQVPPRQSFHVSVNQQFRYPPQEIFTPVDESVANGSYSRSRSLSQASAGVQRSGHELMSPIAVEQDDPRDAFRGLNGHFQHGHHPSHRFPQPQPLQQGAPPEVTMRMENTEALRQHVQSQLGNPILADCHLQIIEEETGARQYVDAHKIIVSRSPRLFDLVQRSAPPENAAPKTQVRILLRGSQLRIKAFMDCMQYLYGGSLFSLENLRHFGASPDPQLTNEQRMQISLSYVAMATWLAIPAIAVRAMGIALGLLHWDSISAVLSFALDGGLGPAFIIDDGSESISCSSSDDSHGRADGIGVPTYDPYATDLLHRFIDFTVHMFPPNFYLDASAPQLTSCPRLPPQPPAHESRPSRSNPRLSQIKFGELSLDDHNRPSQVTTTISSMLLSLPFALLKCILEHNGLLYQLGPDTVASIMRQVIAEREVRRKRIVQARAAAQMIGSADGPLAQNLFLQESVEPSQHHRAGFRLVRRRLGVETPTSSGAASEKT